MVTNKPTGELPKPDQHRPADEHCACVICRRKKKFELAPDLEQAFLGGDVVVFAGAGVSTENKEIMGYSLFDEICKDLTVSPSSLSFSEAMERFCLLPNGRLKLVHKILERINYIESMPELYDDAVRFHRALATLFSVRTIITTNWDLFFERECGAQPFTFSEDIAFWDAAERRVLKIHGTLNNLSSIVLTQRDYSECLTRLTHNLIGSNLKMLLASRTIVFCGYSLRDEDFQQIMTFVQSEMNGFHKQAYVVTLDSSAEAAARYQAFGLVPIFTDAEYFVERVKATLEEHGECIPDAMYDFAAKLLAKLRKVHVQFTQKTDMHKQPETMYCAFYQDGLIHALERILHLRKLGTYSDGLAVFRRIEGYRRKRTTAVRRRRYDDVAYIDGYATGLVFVATFPRSGPVEFPPLYYAFGTDRDIWSLSEYMKVLPKLKKLHPAAYRCAKNIVARTPGMSEGKLVLDHKCQLYGLEDRDQHS